MVRNSSCNASRFDSALDAAEADLLVDDGTEEAGGRRWVSRRINLSMRELMSFVALKFPVGVADAPASFSSNDASLDSICSNDVGGEEALCDWLMVKNYAI